MSDDPRDILKAAGVECAEVEAYVQDNEGGDAFRFVSGDAAVIALARLVAEFKHQLDDRTERVKQAIERSRVTAVSPQDVLDLINRIAMQQDDEKRDAYLAAKYKWQRDEAINLTADSEDEATDLLEDVEQGWRVEHDIRLVPKDDWHTGKIGPDRWFRARAQGRVRADAPAAPLG